MSVLSRLLGVPLRVLQSLYAILAALLPFLPAPNSHRRLAASGPDHDHVLARYEARFSAQHPPFYRGSYKQLVADVKEKLELALVYLHAEDHDDTHAFCTGALASEELAAVVSEFKVNVWLGDLATREGYEVASLLAAPTHPALFLITLTSVGGVTKPAVVFRHFGPALSATTLATKLREAIQTHGLFLATVRAEREAREADRRMREMADAAYNESLRIDREREQRRREEEERKQREAEERQRKLDAEAQVLKDRKARRAEHRASLPAEPNLATTTPQQRVVVQFVLPNGSRVRRTFAADTATTVRSVYAFVDTLDPLGEDDVDEEQWAMRRIEEAEALAAASSGSDTDEQPPGDVEKEWGFVLVQAIPRREFRDLDMNVADAGMRGASLLVELA